MKKIYLLLLMLIVGIGSTWADFTPQVSTSTTRYYYSFSSYSGRGYKIFTDPNTDAGTFGAGNDGTATAAQYFFEEGSATGQYYIRTAFSGKYWVSASTESNAAVTLTATKASATEWVVVNGGDYVTFKPSGCTANLGIYHNGVSEGTLAMKLYDADPSNVTNGGSWWTPTLQQTITLPFEVSADVTSATKYYNLTIKSSYNIYADLDGGTAIKSKATTETYSNQDYFKWAVGGSWDTGFYFYNKAAKKYLSYGTSASPSDNTNATLVDALETGSYLDLLHKTSTISYFRIHGSTNSSFMNQRSENLGTWASGSGLGDTGSLVTIAAAEDIAWSSELFDNAKSTALSTVSTLSTQLPALFASADASTATTTIDAITCTSESEYETKIAAINTAMATFYKSAEGKNVSIQQRGARNSKNYYLQANRTGSNYTSNETLTGGAVFNVVSNGNGTFNFQSALYGNYLPNLGSASASIASSATAGAYNLITTSTVGEMKFDALVCGWSGYSGIHLDGSCNIVVWENTADANVWTVAAVSDEDWSTLVTSALSGVKYTIGKGVGTFTDDESGSMATAQTQATSATTTADKVSAFQAILAAESKVTLNDAAVGECFRMKSSVTGNYLSSTTSAPAAMVEASAATDNATVWCWTSKGLINASTGLYYDGYNKTASSTAYTATVEKDASWFGTYGVASNGAYIYNASGTTIDRGSATSVPAAAGYAWVLEKVDMNVYEVAVAGISTTDAVLTYNSTDYAPGANIYTQSTLTTSDVTAKAQTGYGSVVRLSGATFTVQYYTDLSSKTRVSSLDDLSNTTAYIINNKNNEGAMVIIPTLSTTLANLNNVTTTDYTIGKTEFMNALDATDANQLWQILKDGDGKYYIYNVGQQKYLTLSSGRYQLTATTTATTTVTLSEGKLQFSADGGSYNYATSCTNNTNGAVAWWSADDHGASWEVIAVDGTYADPLTLPNWAALTEAYNQATPYKDYIGTGLNKYTAEGFTDAYANVSKAYKDKATYYTTDKKNEVDGYTAAMNTAYGNLSLNMPTTGWYRIASANDGLQTGNKGHYLTNVNSDGLTLTATADNTTTMMYIDRENNKIKDYNGNYLNNYNEDPDATGKTWEIEAGTKIGTYAFKLNGGTWYASDWSESDKITFGNKDNNAIWNIEVTTITETRETPADKYGTICLPYDFTAEGAVVMSFTGRSDKGLVFEPVSGTTFSAGVPYLYRATAATQTFTTTGTTWAAATAVNNFTGSYTELDLSKTTSNTTENFFLYTPESMFYPAGEYVHMSAYKCYFPTLPDVSGARTTANSVVFSIMGETTGIYGIDTTADLNKNGKFIQNGRMVIVNNGKKFNAAGQNIK